MSKRKQIPSSGRGSGEQMVQQLLVQGAAFHQKGQFEQAQGCYEQVLKQFPKHFEALHLSGVNAYKSRNYPQALVLLTQAAEINPNRADVYFSLGNVLHALKEFSSSVECYDRAIALKPDYAQAYSNRGNVLYELKQYGNAVESYERAIALKPDYADAYSNCGNVLQELNEFMLAVECYDKVIEINPDYVLAYNNRGNALRKLKQFELALQNYDRAIALKPDYAEAYSNRGNVLQELKRFDIALQSYDKAIALRADYAEAYANRGSVLKELKQMKAALQSCDRAIELRPDYPVAWNNRGLILKELMQLDDALKSYDKAIALKPDYADAWYNRGIALQTPHGFTHNFTLAVQNYDQAIGLKPDHADAYNNKGTALQAMKQFDAAMENYDKAIAVQADCAEAHFNKGLLHLLRGNFSEGWQGYEWRWENKELGMYRYKREFDVPRWSGHESLEGRTILLYAEQGFGDTLQFCRYVKLVAERGAKVILEVQPPLVTLLQDLEGVSQIIAQGETLPAFDFHCPLLSLPLAFNTDLHSIPQSEKYLRSDANKVAEWKARLGVKIRPRVGVVWSGNPGHKNDHHRSIALSDFIYLLSDNCQFICLQKDIREPDKAVLEAHPEIINPSDQLGDFMDTAALCELMDIVISVDTSVLHLAGAMGKQTWALLPYVPDWRWLLDREDSPWYSGMRLYRQAEAGNWSDVLAWVKADLKQVE